jgi:hypothetical protein
MENKKGIVARIKELLKLGDDGKVDSFFAKQRKALTRMIEAHKRNIDNAKFNHEKELEELREKLEDAETAKESAYLNVPVERISNNADQDAYASVYWNGIERAEQIVQNINRDINYQIERYDNNIELINEQVAELEFRLTQIQ